jgi:hypothetical protein
LFHKSDKDLIWITLGSRYLDVHNQDI